MTQELMTFNATKAAFINDYNPKSTFDELKKAATITSLESRADECLKTFHKYLDNTSGNKTTFPNSHVIKTPMKLCEEIVLNVLTDPGFNGTTFLVLYTIEFYIALIKYGVLPENITFYAPVDDDKYKHIIAKKVFGSHLINSLDIGDDMKFDVVVGNPPYQSGNGEKGGKHSLWRKFIKKGFNMVNPNGFVAFICPGFPYKANDLSDHFNNNTPLILVNDVSHHFPGVASEIKYWVVKEGSHNEPFHVDGNLWPTGLNDDPTLHPLVNSILKKLQPYPVFNCKQDKGYSSTQFKNDTYDYFETPTGKAVYPIRHASNIKVCYVSKPTECHTKNKVMMTFSGYPDFEYFDGTTNPISSCYQMSGYIEVSDAVEGAALIAVYNTSLYKFLSNLSGAGMKGTVNYCLPKVDLTRSWTDAELYQHFGLTDDEIAYIESEAQ